MIGVLARLCQRQMLDGLLVVYGKVPAVVAALVPFRRCRDLSFSEQPPMRGCGAARTRSAVNRDVTNLQRLVNLPAEFAVRNEVLSQSQRIRDVDRRVVRLGERRSCAACAAKGGETQ